jgi:hypothetical protein
MQQMFIKRLFYEWRVLFGIVLVLILAQLFFMYKGIENVPFFLYHMYAQPHSHKDSATVLLVKTENGYIFNKSFSNRQEELLLNAAGYWLSLKSGARDTILPVVESRFKDRLPAAIYTRLEQQLSNSSAAIDSFPDWWSRYFYSIRPKTPGQAWLVQSRVSLNPPYSKSPQDSILFTISR